MHRISRPLSRIALLLAIVATLVSARVSAEPQPDVAAAPKLRPPAVPLVTFDPYLSIWSEADHLTDDVTRHWTGRPHSLVSLIRVDGQVYRLMGNEPSEVPALPQVSEATFPTRTVYEFENPTIHVTMTFTTTALPQDLEVYSRPLSYISWDVWSRDGRTHAASIYQSVSSELTVNTPDQKVRWSRLALPGLTTLKIGSDDQTLMEPKGDNVRIDWGYAYLSTPGRSVLAAIGSNSDLESAFTRIGALPARDDTDEPRAVSDRQPVMAVVMPLTFGRSAQRRHVVVAYDELYAISYFGKLLRPYWRRNGRTIARLLEAADRDFSALSARCQRFDEELMEDLTRTGGARYAQVAALALRQSFAGMGLAADSRGQPLLFTKENTSNGDIATVDVIFPMEPILLLLSPSLAEASLVSNLDYAASSHWKFPNAPHDLGTYPVVTGRDDGGEGMPVEESGNLLILCDAICRARHNASFVAPWWPVLSRWAHFLQKYGLDPENQLCTDDFMGHLAHNANLSVKAIIALAAYGDLCRMRGDKASARAYQSMAVQFARHWMSVASDGDHYRLAFDRPGTWSQKYNLVWDQLLGLHVFPPAVHQKEIAFYKSVLQRYGVPLDSRTHLTKTDWSYWSATMADSNADFRALTDPIFDYLNNTTSRVPLVDSYETDNVHSSGMHARPVVGGIFIKALANPALWQKWASRDTQRPGPWAALPQPPRITEVVPTARKAPVIWRYTTQRPPANWTAPGFNDSSWPLGPAGFGTAGTPGILVRTRWDTDDIWLRRTFTMPAGPHSNLSLLVYHDEDVEIYFDGILAGAASGFVTQYTPLTIHSAALRKLRPGAPVIIAVHCHQTTGGQGIDVGLAEVTTR